MKTNRRSFLKTSTMATVPLILPSRVWSAEVKPNDQITMGFIGMGKQNGGLLRGFLGQDNVRVLAVCEVDRTRREAAQKKVDEHYGESAGNCDAYNDMRELIDRKDIDAVCIATPDHWHAYPTINALRSGKDVYCEKPLTHNIHEAVEVIKAVDANGRVLQTGSMQRSMKEFRVACEMVQGGAIGKIEKVLCSFGGPGIPCDLPEEEMEPGLDWDMWVGPGPMRPYNSILSPRGIHNHFPHWRTYKEYGSGAVGDWGAHHLDIAQWGLGMDANGPVKVTPPDDPSATKGGILTYANGITVHHVSGFGVEFIGDKGVINVNRGKFELYLGGEKIAGFTKREDGGSLDSALVKARQAVPENQMVKLYESSNHLVDFLESAVSRKKPNTNEQVGGRSAICCHLLNQSYYHHAEIEWNPEKLTFAKGSGKKAWMTRDYRGPWAV